VHVVELLDGMRRHIPLHRAGKSTPKKFVSPKKFDAASG
jgi:hypothetical protein